jgi:hypothetical protein
VETFSAFDYFFTAFFREDPKGLTTASKVQDGLNGAIY